jgi:hypothetical protein
VRAIAAFMLVLCSCATPRDSSAPPPCLHPLLEYEGRGARGGAIYRLYGWSRADRYNASLESALPDRPDVVARLHRADVEHAAGSWLLLGGAVGMVLGAGVTMLSAPGPNPGDRPDEPGFAIGLGDIALDVVTVAVGAGLFVDGNRRWSRALGGYNAEAEQQGCRPAPLP